MARTHNTFAVAFVAALLAAPLASAMHESTPSAPSAQVSAMTLRGLALDRLYHIGPYAGPSAQETRALRLRGLALDRIYHVGPYARTTGGSSGWGDVEIGGAAAFGVIVVGLGAAVALRKRRLPLPA